MIDIVRDISTLTTVPERTLKKMVSKGVFAVNEAVLEALVSGEKDIELNIGLGTLYLRISDETVKYRFVPSSELEQSLKNTILHKQNLLEDALDAALVTRLTNIYKELF